MRTSPNLDASDPSLLPITLTRGIQQQDVHCIPNLDSKQLSQGPLCFSTEMGTSPLRARQFSTNGGEIATPSNNAVP
eukprot:scaffold149774_cov18-Tisochrysis_lutea.AAC.1